MNRIYFISFDYFYDSHSSDANGQMTYFLLERYQFPQPQCEWNWFVLVRYWSNPKINFVFVIHKHLGRDFFSSLTDTRIPGRWLRRCFCSRLFFCAFVSGNIVFVGSGDGYTLQNDHFFLVSVKKYPCTNNPSTWNFYLCTDNSLRIHGR